LRRGRGRGGYISVKHSGSSPLLMDSVFWRRSGSWSGLLTSLAWLLLEQRVCKRDIRNDTVFANVTSKLTCIRSNQIIFVYLSWVRWRCGSWGMWTDL
jgi:hypothetical protein